MSFDFILAALGLLVVLWRLKPWIKIPMAPRAEESTLEINPLISIIVPCRNEAENLKTLLPSLLALSGGPYEIIVVDDHSNDLTFETASKFPGVRVLKAPIKPEGWVGKSWACWYGAQQAQGECFLFTDADTKHYANSLREAFNYMKTYDVDLLSAPPYHRAENSFEPYLGLFHLIPLVATAFHKDPRLNRLYAIGQYLLINQEAYFSCGGHKAIKDNLVDDFEMAKLILKDNRNYRVYPLARLFEVQMYKGTKEFWHGWKRLLRLGMKRVSPGAIVETVLVFHLFWQPFWRLDFVLLIALVTLAIVQRQHGAFSIWGVFFAPISVFLFILLSLLGTFESLAGKKVVWNERAYTET